MTIIPRIAKNNECYQIGTTMKPTGVMIHSTGCNQTQLAVYYRLFNVFHPGGRQTCPHAFIGYGETGRIETWQLLPWEVRGWHSGSGSKGNANRMGYIGIEMCEDDLSDAAYFWKVFREAVEVTAHLCRSYGIPASRVICHSEGHAMGIASNHADVMHWFPRHGTDMDCFREEVEKAVEKSMNTDRPTGSGTAGDQTAQPIGSIPSPGAEKVGTEDQSVTTPSGSIPSPGAGKVGMEDHTVTTPAENIPSPGAEEAVRWAIETGILRGDPDGSLRLRDPVTREEAVIMLHRADKLAQAEAAQTDS